LILLARPTGLEPVTYGLEVQYLTHTCNYFNILSQTTVATNPLQNTTDHNRVTQKSRKLF
jgi:hypothetical protein